MPEQADRRRDHPAGASAGRRLIASALTVGALVASLALVSPGATALAEEAAGPVTQCRVTDPRLDELSGLVVGADGTMLAINDGGEQVAVYVLDPGCQVIDVRTAPVDPYDPEDLAVGSDGTVWIADIGDNRGARSTVAMIALRPDGSTPVYRLAYPDGPHDAEALLLAPDGTPYVVTKEVLGASRVYRPVGALDPTATVDLVHVTTVHFTLTGTPGGPVGRAGQLLVTGGAVAAGGHALALRTYTDAYVWPLTGADVPAALAGEPVRVALPPSPQGEAVSFSADGRSLVVASEGLPSDVTVVPIPVASAPAPDAGTPDDALAPDDALDESFPETDDDASLVAAGVIAAVVATLLVWLIGRRRGTPRSG